MIYVITPHWHGTVSWNPSSCKTWTCLFCIFNITGADFLETQAYWLCWTGIIRSPHVNEGYVSNITGPTYKLRLSFVVISDVYMPIIPKKTTFTKPYFTQWMSKRPGSFEIYWVRQCLVNFTGLAGIINATLYKTEPNFTDLGHSKLT